MLRPLCMGLQSGPVVLRKLCARLVQLLRERPRKSLLPQQTVQLPSWEELLMGRVGDTAHAAGFALISFIVVAMVGVLGWRTAGVADREVAIWVSAAVLWVATTALDTVRRHSGVLALWHGSLGAMVAIALLGAEFWESPLSMATVPAVFAHLLTMRRTDAQGPERDPARRSDDHLRT